MLPPAVQPRAPSPHRRLLRSPATSLLLFLPLIATKLTPATPAQVLYVSPSGQSGWSGRLAEPSPSAQDGPLPSLIAARNRAREWHQTHPGLPVTISLRGGAYPLSDTLVLGPEDSNTNYVAFPGEWPVISGGAPVKTWAHAQGQLWTAPVAARVTQLFIDGRRIPRARTPAQGFYRIDGPSSQEHPFTLKFRGADILKSWARADVEVVALLAWAELRMTVSSVDEDAHLARFAVDPRPSNREDNARYWIENAPEGLTAGKWLSRANPPSVVYWPLSGEDPSAEQVIAPRLTTLVRLQGAEDGTNPVHDLIFQGIGFRYTAWELPPGGYSETQAAMHAASAIEAAGTRNIAIDHCTFSHMGGYAIWFGRGSVKSAITFNEISDMGAGGIKLGDTALAPTENTRNADNLVMDNDIHDLGLVSPSAVGIWVGQSSRNTLSHNHIHDLYYTAISVGWTWGYGPNQSSGNRIEWNDLHDIGKGLLSDMGAVYTLGIQPGTVIRNNLIHDVNAFAYGGWGIYTDEGSSRILIENNIVYRTKSAGFHQHYGQDNVIRNNVFALGGEYQLMRTRAEPHLSFQFEHNIVYFDSGSLLGSNWSDDRFEMDNNIYWNLSGETPRFSGRTWEEWRAAGHDRHSLLADPLFVNASQYNFQLSPNSPASKIGFQPIDLHGVGPRVRPGARVD